MVPHLVTALNGPLLDLEKKILSATPAIERWFRLEWQEHTPPFYCSVDLRNAGFKLAPVDTTLVPGGSGGGIRVQDRLHASCVPRLDRDEQRRLAEQAFASLQRHAHL